jgi:hypothetical protein
LLCPIAPSLLLARIGVIGGKRLLQRNDMLWLIMPCPRLGDRFRAARTAGRPKSREVDGIPLAGHDRADKG